jgi:hypothetical protein
MMDIKEIEKRLFALDAEIHKLLYDLSKAKKAGIKAELREYERLKEHISKNLKKPFEPTFEIRALRKKEFTV